MKRSTAAGLAIGVALVGLIGWRGYDAVYAAPRAELSNSLSRLAADAEIMETQLSKRIAEKRELESLSVGMLGGSRDQAEHVLREAVSNLGAKAELDGVLVTTGSLRRMTSPYLSVRRGTSTSVRRRLRDRIDYSVLSATMTGEGTWPQIVEALALAESQPWIARRPTVRIEPANDTRTRFSLRITVEAFHAADLASDSFVPTVDDPSDQARAIAAQLAEIELFRVPPPPPPPLREVEKPPVEVVAERPPPPPPPPPYDRWRLTAVIESPQGVMVVMTNLDGRGSRTLSIGEQIIGATLSAASGEMGTFTIDGAEFDVALGTTLAQRKPKGR